MGFIGTSDTSSVCSSKKLQDARVSGGMADCVAMGADFVTASGCAGARARVSTVRQRERMENMNYDPL